MKKAKFADVLLMNAADELSWGGKTESEALRIALEDPDGENPQHGDIVAIYKLVGTYRVRQGLDRLT